jgi:membrane protease YdiL (CAAX protease family)
MIWQTWSRSRILLWFFLLLVGHFLIQSLVLSLTDQMFLAVAAGGLLGVVLPCWALALLARGSLAGDFWLGRISWSVALWSVLAALGAHLPTAVLADISARLHPLPEAWLELFEAEIPRGSGQLAVAVVGAVILGPLAEELLFRGILYRLARTVWGPVPSALLSAGTFAMMHWEPWFFLGLVGLGVLYAFILEATGSVTACVLAHALHNAVTLVIMTRAPVTVYEDAGGASGLDYGLLALSCVVLAVACFRLSRVREEY